MVENTCQTFYIGRNSAPLKKSTISAGQRPSMNGLPTASALLVTTPAKKIRHDDSRVVNYLFLMHPPRRRFRY